MKKIFFNLLLLCCIGISQKAYASYSLDYYADTFKKDDILVSYYKVTNDGKERRKVGGSDIMLIKASDFVKHRPFERNVAASYVVLCDTAIEFGNLACTTRATKTDPANVLRITSDREGAISVAKLPVEGGAAYFIPLSQFVLSDNEQTYKTFIAELSRAHNHTDTSHKDATPKAVSNLDTFLIEISIVVLIALFFLAVVYSANNKVKVIRSTNNSVSKSFISWLEMFYYKLRPLLWILLVITLVTLFILPLAISLRDTKSINLLYALTYVSDTVKFAMVNQIILIASKVRLLLFSIFIIALLIIQALALKPQIELFRHIHRTPKTNPKKPSFLWYCLGYIFVFLFGVLLLITDASTLIAVVSVSSALIALSLLLLIRENAPTLEIQSTHRKIVYILLGFFLICLPIKAYFFPPNSKLTTKNLFDKQKHFVILPYRLELAENVSYKDRLRSFAFPMYVNDYKVYDPTSPNIENRNIVDFNDTDNWQLLFTDKDDYKASVLKAPKLVDVLESSSSTPLFFSNVRAYSTFNVTIDFDCSQNKPPQKSKLLIHRSDSVKEVDLFEFPGCSSGEDIELVIPIQLSGLGNTLFEVTDYASLGVRDLKVTDVEDVNSIVYLRTFDNNALIVKKHEQAPKGDKVINYSPSIAHKLEFNSHENKIDLADVSTQLANLGEKSVSIWSPDSTASFSNK